MKQDQQTRETIHQIYDLLIPLSDKYPGDNILKIIYAAVDRGFPPTNKYLTNSDILEALSKYYKLSD